MSASEALNGLVKALVPFLDAPVNFATQHYYTVLNVKQEETLKLKNIPYIHYNLKAAFYNLATIYGIYKLVSTFFGMTPVASMAVHGFIVFYARKVIDLSLSTEHAEGSSTENIFKDFNEGKTSIWNKELTAAAVKTVTHDKTSEKINVFVGSWPIFKYFLSPELPKQDNAEKPQPEA